ncbi:RlpA-like double-psi beta-barrel-protein domain-containing protein-containing protein [Mycena belliarum]|uniref:RlpA-like double-psi beta-barrel-protein domain-containing protein-containing protein n=1 Tax=Mycena belliarum TaxID=1033014 RepID=A0AAD6XU23_9AGAR|nr:RlpA-like double-psi beta-barrel-protein domain-containing protein-containing protein [Mycena belliae]
MSRVAVLFALLFCAVLALAAPAPAPQGNATTSTFPELDKRVTHTGRGTWYYPSQNQGNCGFWDSDSSPVVAISKARYDANNGGNCNQWVAITNKANGKTAYGRTRDSCQSCDQSSLDMSPGLFKKIASLGTGEITISWHFQAKGWSP